MQPLLLGVNLDHVATLRQARYATMPDSPNVEPSVLDAARAAKLGGADSLTIHVREDRRHMQDRDAFELREKINLPLNLEMGVTQKMTEFAKKLRPDFVCLVPESREEITTEGGLDVVAQRDSVARVVEELSEAGIRVSLFIDPKQEQVEMAAKLKASMIELHTGGLANAQGHARLLEQARLHTAACLGYEFGLQINAGHGINYTNIFDLFAVSHLTELNIGHTIVTHSLFVGFQEATRKMKECFSKYHS